MINVKKAGFKMDFRSSYSDACILHLIAMYSHCLYLLATIRLYLLNTYSLLYNNDTPNIRAKATSLLMIEA